jgi:hypothetical protein
MTPNEELVKLSMDEIKVLDLFASIEMKCADLYRQFEVLYADLPEIALLWRKTAAEEDNHAQQFKLASRLKGRGMEGVKVDGVQGTIILRTIETYLNKIQLSYPSPTEALSFAIQLEENLSEYHMSSVVHFINQELSKLFTTMMGNDQGHITMLKNALDNMTKNLILNNDREAVSQSLG